MPTCVGCGVEFEGAPQARFHSDACRKASRRRELERVKAALAGPELDEVVAAIVALENQEIDRALGKPAPRELPISEGQYVALTLAEPNILDRKRAERYARWRYKGVLAGRVAGL